MKELLKKLLLLLGYEINRFPCGNDKRIIDLLKKRNINLVLDIGANIGQYSKFLRHIGYKGKIISFEPLQKEYEELKLNSDADKNWNAYNFAIGNENKKGIINVAGNSYSSSILKMNNIHLESAPESMYVGTQDIEIKKLDNFLESNSSLRNNNIFLKLDVQGYEKNVILGAENSLNLLKGIQLELSFYELYEGETIFSEMVEFLREKNYYLSFINPEFSNPKNDKLLQVNTIFLKNETN